MLEGDVTELRWLLSREQCVGTFAEPIPWPDGTTVFARLQAREAGMASDAPWREIPIVSEITEAPRLQVVTGRSH